MSGGSILMLIVPGAHKQSRATRCKSAGLASLPPGSLLALGFRRRSLGPAARWCVLSRNHQVFLVFLT